MRPVVQAFGVLAFVQFSFWLTGAAAATTPALVVEVDTGAVLYAEDAGRPWYPASTTKLMTALVTFEALQAGEVTLETPVVMSREAMRQESLHAGLEVGRAMSLRDAMYAAFSGSANEVAVALAETVAGSEATFVSRMNIAAQRLGLTGSHFANPNGLFDRSQHVSARDLAILTTTIYRRFPQYHSIFQTSRVIVDGTSVDSFNELLTSFPGALGMKTGFLCASGRNIVALAERNGRLVMVVLLGATTDRERGERAAKLMTEAFSGELMPTGQAIGDIANHPDDQPEDMRLRLCSDQAAPYEAKRNALFPMGLPGHKSYLHFATEPITHEIHTWQVSLSSNVPIPTARPEH